MHNISASVTTFCDFIHHEQTDVNGSIYGSLSRYSHESSIFVETGQNLETNSYIQKAADGNFMTFRRNPSADGNYYIVKRNDSCNHGISRCHDFSACVIGYTCSNPCRISSSYMPIYLKKQNLGLAAATLNISEINHIINLGIININKRSYSHRYGYFSRCGEKPTALYLALHGCGDQRMKFLAFKLLVDAGADINQTVYSSSLIQEAALIVENKWNWRRRQTTTNDTTSREMEILKLLICKGAKITDSLNYKGGAVNEAISQLFNKYKQLLIAAKDDQSPLNCFPREILSYISILSTRITYDNETPKKKIEEVSENSEKKIEETCKKVEERFLLWKLKKRPWLITKS